MDQRKINKEIFGRLGKLEKAVFSDTEDKPMTIIKDGDGIKKLVKKTKVSEEKIREMFDLEDEILTVIKVNGSNPKEKTQSVSLLTLLGYKYFINKAEVSAQEIRRNVAENAIPLENFATYLNELVPSLIRRKGKAKSPKTTYRLMVFGESKARELIKQLCEKD